MDIPRLLVLLRQTTRRNGELQLQINNVTPLFRIPKLEGRTVHQSDCFLDTIFVDLEKAKAVKDEFVRILQAYPNPSRLAAGPSYLEIADHLGQGTRDVPGALMFMALGEALGLWIVRTPRDMEVDPEKALEMVRNGLIVMHKVDLLLTKRTAT